MKHKFELFGMIISNVVNGMITESLREHLQDLKFDVNEERLIISKGSVSNTYTVDWSDRMDDVDLSECLTDQLRYIARSIDLADHIYNYPQALLHESLIMELDDDEVHLARVILNWVYRGDRSESEVDGWAFIKNIMLVPSVGYKLTDVSTHDDHCVITYNDRQYKIHISDDSLYIADKVKDSPSVERRVVYSLGRHLTNLTDQKVSYLSKLASTTDSDYTRLVKDMVDDQVTAMVTTRGPAMKTNGVIAPLSDRVH